MQESWRLILLKQPPEAKHHDPKHHHEHHHASHHAHTPSTGASADDAAKVSGWKRTKKSYRAASVFDTSAADGGDGEMDDMTTLKSPESRETAQRGKWKAASKNYRATNAFDAPAAAPSASTSKCNATNSYKATQSFGPKQPRVDLESLPGEVKW